MRRALIMAAVGALSLAACSSSSSSSVPTPASTGGGGGGAAGNSLSLTVSDFKFAPAALTASAGTVTVKVTNDGPSIHSFTLDDDSASVDVPAGSTKTVTLNIIGSVGFHCHFHPTMKGTITVGGAAVTAPTSSSTGTTPRY